MSLVYIAGAYSGATDAEIDRNVANAARIMREVFRLGFTPVCPHTMYDSMRGQFEENEFKRADMELLFNCDHVVLVPGWMKSAGTIAEIAFAKNSDIPVYSLSEFVASFNGAIVARSEK